jgi:hypothetical protein
LAVVTADGRFVTRSDDNQFRERRLTSAGVQRLRDELTATGLLERDQNFPLVVRPDATPPAHGIGAFVFKVRRDSRTVEVQTATSQGAEEVYYQPSPERTRLDQLSRQLLRPETWLPADAWADSTPRPYSPGAFALLLRTEVVQANESQTIDALTAAWPFSVGPLALGQTLPPTAGPQADMTRCSALTSDDTLAVRDAITQAGGADAVHVLEDGGFLAAFAFAGNQGRLVLIVRPLLPDRASCSGEYVQ